MINIIETLLLNKINYNYIWFISIPIIILQIIIIGKSFNFMDMDNIIILSYKYKIINIDEFELFINKNLYECSICFENIDNIDIFKTKCNHKYHIDCILKWDKNTCPLCRRDII